LFPLLTARTKSSPLSLFNASKILDQAQIGK
jgi:hypothetical protein